MRCSSARHKLGLGLLGLLLNGALLGVSAPIAPALAEDQHPIDSVLEMMNLKAAPGNTPDFVKQSRPETQGDFVPVGTKHPDRTIKKKSPADVKAAEAELDAARTQQEHRAGVAPAPAAAKPKKVAPKKAPGGAPSP